MSVRIFGLINEYSNADIIKKLNKIKDLELLTKSRRLFKVEIEDFRWGVTESKEYLDSLIDDRDQLDPGEDDYQATLIELNTAINDANYEYFQKEEFLKACEEVLKEVDDLILKKTPGALRDSS